MRGEELKSSAVNPAPSSSNLVTLVSKTSSPQPLTSPSKIPPHPHPHSHTHPSLDTKLTKPTTPTTLRRHYKILFGETSYLVHHHNAVSTLFCPDPNLTCGTGPCSRKGVDYSVFLLAPCSPCLFSSQASSFLLPSWPLSVISLQASIFFPIPRPLMVISSQDPSCLLQPWPLSASTLSSLLIPCLTSFYLLPNPGLLPGLLLVILLFNPTTSLMLNDSIVPLPPSSRPLASPLQHQYAPVSSFGQAPIPTFPTNLSCPASLSISFAKLANEDPPHFVLNPS